MPSQILFLHGEKPGLLSQQHVRVGSSYIGVIRPSLPALSEESLQKALNNIRLQLAEPAESNILYGIGLAVVGDGKSGPQITKTDLQPKFILEKGELQSHAGTSFASHEEEEVQKFVSLFIGSLCVAVSRAASMALLGKSSLQQFRTESDPFQEPSIAIEGVIKPYSKLGETVFPATLEFLQIEEKPLRVQL